MVFVTVHLRQHDVHEHEIDASASLCNFPIASLPVSAERLPPFCSVPACLSWRRCCAHRRPRSAPSCRRRMASGSCKRCNISRLSSGNARTSRDGARARSDRRGVPGLRTSLTIVVCAMRLSLSSSSCERSFGGVNDDRQMRVLAADLVDQLEARHVRQHQVEHHAIELFLT